MNIFMYTYTNTDVYGPQIQILTHVKHRNIRKRISLLEKERNLIPPVASSSLS